MLSFHKQTNTGLYGNIVLWFDRDIQRFSSYDYTLSHKTDQKKWEDAPDGLNMMPDCAGAMDEQEKGITIH